MLRKIGIMTVCFAFVWVLNVYAGGGGGDKGAQGGGIKTFTFGRAEDIQNFDPFNQNNLVNGIVNSLVYNFLVASDHAGNFSPELATGWTTSPDGLTWTLKLRTGVKFHNGEALTSDDVKTTFDRIITDKTLIKYSLFTFMDSIEAPDDTTVIFRLKEPSGLMLMFLASCPIYPGDLWREKGAAMFNQTIGSGPFKFVSWTQGQQIVYEKNTDYWGPNPSNVDRIVYRNVTEDTTRISGLRTGALDMVDSIPADQLDLLTREGFKVDRIMATDLLYAGFRFVNSPFADINARRAFHHAIDREGIVKNILGGGRASTFYAGVNMVGFDPSLKVPEYNTALAKDYLSKSSYKGEPIRFIGPIGNYTRIDEVLQAIASMLMDAGFNVNLEMIEGASFQARRVAGEYDVYVTGASSTGGDVGTLLAQRWVGDSLNSGYRNQEQFDLVNAANRESDPAKRAQLLQQAMKMGWDNLAPWTSLYQMDNNIAYSSKISGAKLYGDKSYNFREVMKAD